MLTIENSSIMKKLLVLASFIAFSATIFGACHGDPDNNNFQQKSSTSVKQNKSDYSIHINRQQFLTRVMDYTKGPDQMRYLGDKPAIVDFWASWCRPCMIASPILEELAKEYDGKIYVYKVNTQTEQQIAAELGIQSIPTFIFFPVTGKPFATSGIAQTPEETKKMFKEIIEQQLLKTKK